MSEEFGAWQSSGYEEHEVREQTITDKIARNSIFGVVRVVVVTPLVLLITPYALHNLGEVRFGIWALLGVLTAYAKLSDFGMSTGLIKFVAEYQARQEYETRNQLLSTALVLYTVFGGALMLVTFALLGWIVDEVFRLPAEVREEAIFVYAGGMIIFALSLTLNTFSSALQGLQKMDITNALGVVGNVLRVGGTFFFLEAGYGLRGLVFNEGLVALVVAGLGFYFLKRATPDLRLSPVLFRRRLVRTILGYSLNVQISNVAGLFIFQINKVVLSHFLSVAAVSFFELGLRFADRVRVVVFTAVYPVLPAVSEVQVRRGMERVHEIYYRSLRYLLLFGAPVFLLTAVLAPPFTRLWLGPGFERTSVTLQVLSVAFFVTALSFPGSFIVHGIGWPQYSTYASLANGLMTVVFSTVLVKTMGYYGVVVGVLLAQVLQTIFFYYLFHRATGASLGRARREIFSRTLLINVGLAVAAFGLVSRLGAIGWGELVMLAGGYMAVYGLAVLKSGCMGAADRELLKHLLPARLASLL